MSAFLGYESFLIPLGSTRNDVHTTIRSALNSKGWQIVHDSLLVEIDTILGTLFTTGTYPITNAFDRNYDTTTASTAALPLWVGCKFKLAAQITLVRLVGDIASLAQTPKDFTIDYSDDGSTWISALTVTNCVWHIADRESQYFVIPLSGAHLYWRLNVTAKNNVGGYLSLMGVDFFDQYGSLAFSNGTSYFDAIPPSSEIIGDSIVKDLVRFEFSSTSINVRAVAQSMTGSYQTIMLYQKTAGNVQYGITLDGVTVNQDPLTQNTSNTAKQNLRFLYDAIRSSNDPKITVFDWEYQTPSPQNADDANDYIYGVCKTSAPPVPYIFNTNVNSNVYSSEYVPVGYTTMNSFNKHNAVACSTITIDLINGFIYYLQINSRGIAIATKTNTAFYGPIHACYADHTKALAAKPTAKLGIIELLVGVNAAQTSNNVSASARPSHYWGMCVTTSVVAADQTSQSYAGDVFGRSQQRNKFTNIVQQQDVVVPLTTNCGWSVSNVANDFQVHRISNPQIYSYDYSYTTTTSFIVPALDINDWYRFCGSAVNEALLLVTDTQISTALNTTLLDTDTPSSIPVVSTVGFNSSGFFSIGGEIFQYTGVTATNFTGISRAKYGTIAVKQYAGDVVSQCLWFTVINGGALFCGYNKPS